jgi:hypothetical protein
MFAEQITTTFVEGHHAKAIFLEGSKYKAGY